MDLLCESLEHNLFLMAQGYIKRTGRLHVERVKDNEVGASYRPASVRDEVSFSMLASNWTSPRTITLSSKALMRTGNTRGVSGIFYLSPAYRRTSRNDGCVRSIVSLQCFVTNKRHSTASSSVD
jgi:hypothetical protein